jgi:hypothetical protein
MLASKRCLVVTDQALATTLGDREGILASKIEELLPGVVRRFDVVAVQATTQPPIPGFFRSCKRVGLSSPPQSWTQIGADDTAERHCAWR